MSIVEKVSRNELNLYQEIEALCPGLLSIPGQKKEKPQSQEIKSKSELEKPKVKKIRNHRISKPRGLDPYNIKIKHKTFKLEPNADFYFELPDSGISLDEIEKRVILRALKANNWVQFKTAVFLRTTPRKMNYLIKKYRISHPDWEVHKMAGITGAL